MAFVIVLFLLTLYSMTKKNLSKALVTKTTRLVAKETVKSAPRAGRNIQSSPDASLFESVLTKAKALSVTKSGWTVAEGMEHLVKVDKKFIDIFGKYGIPEALANNDGTASASAVIPLPVSGSSEDCYVSLLKIIIYQQLSIKAAAPILNRFMEAFGGKEGTIQPSMVKTAKFETVIIDGKRKILLNGAVSGLSESKAKYIADLTDHFLDPTKLQNVNLSTLTDDELREKLLAVKGLGPWSVDMFMMFDLQRANVLPVGDLVVRKGLAMFHNLPEKHFENKKNLLTVHKLCEAWAPYSSLASGFLYGLNFTVNRNTK